VQQKHLNILEFPKVLERLAKYASFSASKSLALELQPTPYFNQARDWQAETSEADHLLSVKVNIGVGGARDVRPHVARAHRGVILTAQELLEVRQTLISARELKRSITRMAEVYPRLADIAQRMEECVGVVNAIGQAIEENGEIKSSASPKLARIRRDLDIAHNRLMEKLNRIIASSQNSQYLQEALVTQRGGRYVIPLKAEFKSKIQGVVQDQSASGATIFIEPLATVELNNQCRQLELDEEEEIRRILAELSEVVDSQGELIDHTVTALAELDLAFAKAKYGHAIEAVEPNLVSFEGQQSFPTEPGDKTPIRPHFKLVAGRHPLLDPKTVVPIDVELAEGTHILVITGPNTGGKTVSLKTVGLLTAMGQAGLRIPAGEGSTLPVFNRIFADIGDEQSIEQSLSTFSGHMTNVVQILSECDEHSLAIFDELGAGTDPIEGSALAHSILLYLLEREVTTFVATHYSELKAFAHSTPGVTNASMEFDLESLAPTYRLLIGVPGESNAFTIAGRLGLTAEIINRARGLVSENARQIEAMLAEIKAQTEAAQQARRQAEVEREKAEEIVRQRQAQLAEIEAERREILNSARADARREIKAIREKIRSLEQQAQEAIQRQQQALEPLAEVREVEAQLEVVETETMTQKAPEPVSEQPTKTGGPIRVGDKVFITQFSAVGEVVAIQNKQVEVQLGHFRATVPLASLELRERAATAPEQGRIEPRVSTPTVESPGMELDLRGRVAEEAMIYLDQYLDRAFMARLPWVRIIHGKGSGVLRQVVREELSHHPMISSYRPGQEGEGGDGVTIAKLAVS
jgi:DNA mismatch repair protein MutS2